jgi:hypothetical protein
MIKDKNYLNISSIYIICIIIIITYSTIKCKLDFPDPLHINLPIWNLNGWSITHILFFMFIGYNYYFGGFKTYNY